MSNPAISLERRESAEHKAAAYRPKFNAAAEKLRQSITDGSIFLPLIAVALWTLTHDFLGTVGDGAIYIGRALADLDPNGLGRDMMFVDDGQSRFSLFPLLLDRLVPAAGVQATVLMLAVASIAGWLAALSGFARQYAAWRMVAVVVIFLAVLPPSYGSPWRFAFSEVLAVPRPFAEASVVAALAAFAAGRMGLAFFGLVVATLIHPLVALAGWGAFGFVLCLEDRRWRPVVALAAVALLVGAALGVPLLDRLLVIMNPDLKAFAASRSALLFPSKWPSEAIGSIVVQLVSIAIASSFFEGRRRLILLASIFVGLGGIAAQILFGDWLSSLLVIQAQLWRMAWLLAAIGNFALALCAIALSRGGPRANVVLALLAAAWLFREDPAPTAAIAAVALCLHFCTGIIRFPITRTVAWISWACLVVVGLCLNLHYFAIYGQFLAGLPAGGPPGFSYFWNRRYVALPIGALALVFAFAKASRVVWAGQFAAILLLVLLVVRYWDNRPAFQKLLDADRHPPDLARLLESRGGEVLWIDGLTEAWYLAGRPQWASPQQGVSTVFSPGLAVKWRERIKFLIAEHLAQKYALSDSTPSTAYLPHLTRAGVAHLCARGDAPAWIVAPLEEGAIPPELKPRYWHSPVPFFRLTEEADGHYAWHKIANYAVLACAGTEPSRRG